MLRPASSLHFSSQFQPLALRRRALSPSQTEAQAKASQKKWVWRIGAAVLSAVGALGSQGFRMSAASDLANIRGGLESSRMTYQATIPDESAAPDNRKQLVAALKNMIRETQGAVHETRPITHLWRDLRNFQTLETQIERMSGEELKLTDEVCKEAIAAKTPEEFGQIVFDWASRISPQTFESANQQEALELYSKELFMALNDLRVQQNQSSLLRDASTGGLVLTLMLSALAFVQQRRLNGKVSAS